MAGFFETIGSHSTGDGLWAAWVLTGEHAGAKALFTRPRAEEEGKLSLLYSDEDFSREAAGFIGGLTPEENGAVSCGGERIFLEQLSGRRSLIICGAGHVSMPVIRIGLLLDYHVTVIEDREEFAEKAREAGAHRVICSSFEEALDEVPSDEGTAFVIVTRSHMHDMECLHRILGRRYGYAGMMGSRSRSALIRRQLLEEGYPKEKVEELHMPIGLPIGSRTPEEIGVSIMAQIVQVMNERHIGEGFPEGMPGEIVRLAGDGHSPGVLAVIVDKKGEAPRKPGTKMLVRPDGSCMGTVGGGYVEAKVIDAAGEMMKGGAEKTRLIRVGMYKGVLECGGELELFLLRL